MCGMLLSRATQTVSSTYFDLSACFRPVQRRMKSASAKEFVTFERRLMWSLLYIVPMDSMKSGSRFWQVGFLRSTIYAMNLRTFKPRVNL